MLKACTLWQARFPGFYLYLREHFLPLPSPQKLKDRPLPRIRRDHPTDRKTNIDGAKWAGIMAAYCSLEGEGMSTNDECLFDPRLDKLFGHTSSEAESTPVLANSIHCFVLASLGRYYVIPLGMFFLRRVSGDEVYQSAMQVIRLVEK